MGFELRKLAWAFALCAGSAGSVADAQLMRTSVPGIAGAYLAARQASIDSDFRAAARFYTQAMSRDPSNQSHMENAMSAHIALGDFNAGAAVAARLLNSGVNSQIAHMAVVAEQALDGKYEQLAGSFGGTARVGPLVDGLLRAWAHVGAGDLEAGLTGFDVVAENPGLAAFALFHKSLALASAADFEAADDILSGRTKGVVPPNRRGLITHVMVMSQLGQNERAVERISAVMGTDLDATLANLRLRLVAGEVIPFTQVMDPAHGIAEVFYTVAAALKGEASESYALMYARLAEHLNPGNIDTMLLSAEYLEELGQFELAIATYDRVPASAPEYLTAELGRSDALRAAGRSEAAIEVLRQLSKANPSVPSIYAKLGDALRRDSQFDDAIKAYDTSLALYSEISSEHWFSFFARGISHERAGNWDLAEADLRSALELNPGQPQVLNYLGYSLVEKGEKLDEALAMIETAAIARPENGHILDSLGWVLFQLKRYEEAVAPMEAAVEFEATDPIINDHLGDVYWAVGRVIEARFQWMRALSFDPEAGAADRIRRKLEIGFDAVLEEEGQEPIDVAQDG